MVSPLFGTRAHKGDVVRVVPAVPSRTSIESTSPSVRVVDWLVPVSPFPFGGRGGASGGGAGSVAVGVVGVGTGARGADCA